MGDAAEVDPRAVHVFDDVEAVADGREHAQGEEVDLDETGIVDGVLVPLADEAPGHACGLNRYDGGERLGRDDDAADVLADVAREAGDLAGQLDEILPDGSADQRAELGHEAHLIGDFGGVGKVVAELVELGEDRSWQAERLADIEYGAAEAVGGEGGNDGGVLSAVAVVDLLEDFVADVPREVEVDIGQ